MFFSETGQTFQPNQTNCYSLLPEIQIANLTPREVKKHKALVWRKCGVWVSRDWGIHVPLLLAFCSSPPACQ